MRCSFNPGLEPLFSTRGLAFLRFENLKPAVKVDDQFPVSCERPPDTVLSVTPMNDWGQLKSRKIDQLIRLWFPPAGCGKAAIRTLAREIP
jgi:hypothetical protein